MTLATLSCSLQIFLPTCFHPNVYINLWAEIVAKITANKMKSESTGNLQTICLNTCILDLPILIVKHCPFFRVHTLTFLWVVMYKPVSTIYMYQQVWIDFKLCSSAYLISAQGLLIHLAGASIETE